MIANVLSDNHSRPRGLCVWFCCSSNSAVNKPVKRTMLYNIYYLYNIKDYKPTVYRTISLKYFLDMLNFSCVELFYCSFQCLIRLLQSQIKLKLQVAANTFIMFCLLSLTIVNCYLTEHKNILGSKSCSLLM